MNNPVYTTSDERQIQRSFYTPYFMDSLTGRNRENYGSRNKLISEGMANVNNFFGRYNISLDAAKPPTQNEQAWIDAVNNNQYNWLSVDKDMVQKPSENVQYNMPQIHPHFSYGEDPTDATDKEKRKKLTDEYNSMIDNIEKEKPQKTDAPSRYFNLNPNPWSNESKYYIQNRNQSSVEF